MFQIVAFLSSTQSHAFVYLGNPVLDFKVDRTQHDYVEGAVELEKVRVTHCTSGYTDYPVGEEIDPVEGFEVPIDAGNHCSITFYWDSAMDIDGPSYTVRYSEATTTMTLGADIDPVALTPYSVVSGSMSGGSPWLIANIE